MAPMVTEHHKAEFSARLNSALDAAGVPPKGKGRQNAVAKMFDVSQKGARKWLESESMPATWRITQIAQRLGIATEWLLSGNGARALAEERAEYNAQADASNEADSAYPLDAAIIAEILERIEKERERRDNQSQPIRVIATIVAETYPRFLLEKKRARNRQQVIEAAFDRAATTEKARGPDLPRQRGKARD